MSIWFFLLFFGLGTHSYFYPLYANENPSNGQEWKRGNLYEMGVRYGAGFRYKDRFERDLENFTSSFQPGIFSVTNAYGLRNQNWGEGFFRLGYTENQRFGFSAGVLDFQRAGIREVTSDGYLTNLDFNIQTTYVVFTYHYLWNLSRFASIEAGLGFGGNETRWNTKGWSTNGIQTFPQSGKLRGNGISLRMDSALNYRFTESSFLQLGVLWALHSVPSFSGVWNGAAATFAIREDGKTSPLAESKITDSILATNQFIRALDMNAAHWGLYFSVGIRFSD